MLLAWHTVWMSPRSDVDQATASLLPIAANSAARSFAALQIDLAFILKEYPAN